ncbi:MAG: hypothetical protein R3Y09_08900 [Clostridia bacterium]
MKKIFETAAVFRVFDYVSMKPLKNVGFSLPIGYSVLAKGDGYFVILGKAKPAFVKIEITNYQSVTLEGEDIKDDVIVWIKPKISSYSTLIACEKQPEKRAFAYKNDEIRLLLNKDENQDELTIYCERNLVLCGRKLLLVNGQESDIVEVLEQEKDKLVISRLPKQYPKIKTQVYILFEGENDQCEEIQISKDYNYSVIYK